MIFLFTVVAVVIGLAAIARTRRGAAKRSPATTAIIAWAVIGAVRLGLFWGALTLFSGGAEPRQGAGYVILILNSAPELAVAAALSGHPGTPPLVAVLIALTSAALGWMLAWIRFRAAE